MKPKDQELVKSDLRLQTPVIRSGIQRWLLQKLYDDRTISAFLASYKKVVLPLLHPDRTKGASTREYQVVQAALDELVADPALVTDSQAESIEAARESSYRVNLRQLQDTRNSLLETTERLNRQTREHAAELSQIVSEHEIERRELRETIQHLDEARDRSLERMQAEFDAEATRLEEKYQRALADVGRNVVLNKLLEAKYKGRDFSTLRLAYLTKESTLWNKVKREVEASSPSVDAEEAAGKRIMKVYRPDKETPELNAHKSDTEVAFEAPVKKGNSNLYRVAGSMGYFALKTCLQANDWELDNFVTYVSSGGNLASENQRLAPYIVDAIIPGSLLLLRRHQKEGGDLVHRYELVVPLEKRATP